MLSPRLLSPWLCLALLSACGADETVHQPPPPQPPLTTANMYSLEVLPEFSLELDEAATTALAEYPKQYVRGRFRHGTTDIGDVGIRLKGNDTLTTLSEKPSFKVKFNEFVRGQRFMGLEGLIFNNLRADASMLREWLAYEVFRTLGVPAPRTGFATLVVNGEPYGLYLNLEPYNDDYLERAFEDPKGNLYEASDGVDVQRDPGGWDQDEGEDLSRDDLRRLQQAMAGEVDSYFYGSEAPIARQEFFSFAVAEAFVAHFDGYQGPHNFFVYNDPSPDQWYLLPWNLDQAFYRESSAFLSGGFLVRQCLDRSDQCIVDYVLRAQAAMQELDNLDLMERFDEAAAHIDWAARGDTRKRHSQASLEGSRQQMSTWLRQRPPGFAKEVDCLVDGQEPDEDADGWGTCYHDCNDSDPEIYYGAQEICDEVDNDCNGFADDIPACPCPSKVIEGTEFFFCPYVKRWYQGRDFCQAQGHQLAKLDSAEQNAAVWREAHSIAPGPWAIGLSDLEVEGEYRYLDGSEPSFTAWANGQPAHRLPVFDCVFYTGGADPLWFEGNCIETGNFVCSALSP